MKDFNIEATKWAPINSSLAHPRPIYENREAGLLSDTYMREFDDHISRISHQNQAQTLNNNPSISGGENVGVQRRGLEDYLPRWSSQGRRSTTTPVFASANSGQSQSQNQSQSQSRFPIFNQYSCEIQQNDDEYLGQFNNMSFADLFSMKGSMLEPSMRLGNGGGARTSAFFQDGSDCGSSFRARDALGGVNQHTNGVSEGEIRSNQERSFCDLNSRASIKHARGKNTTFVPLTPDLRWRGENILPPGNTTPGMYPTPNKQNGLQEHHKEGEQGIDLNKTPAQKKPRRRRYTPKVVREGKPKRTPKSSTPKPDKDFSETSKIKRTYVRKNKTNPPACDEENEEIDSKTTKKAVRSCKKSLNFDLNESQETEGSSSLNISEPQFQKDEGLTVETSHVGIAYDLNRTLHQELKNYISQPTVNTFDDLLPNQTFTAELSSKIDGGVQLIGSKRGHSSTRDETLANHPTFWQPSLTSLGNGNINHIMFPEICKKKRSDKVERSNPSDHHPQVDASKNYCRTPGVFGGNSAGGINQAEILMRNVQNKAHLWNDWADIARLKKKRSKGITRVRDLSALKGIASITPATPSPNCPQRKIEISEKPYFDGMSYLNPLKNVNSCLEALTGDAHSTPRSKRGQRKLTSSRSPNIGKANKHWGLVLYDINQSVRKKKVSSRAGSIRWISTFSLEAITEGLKQLDINRKSRCREQNAIVPYHTNDEEQSALVVYKKDGTVVPYEGPFKPIRKRRQRPKVELDDETTRVWRLLLENIDNQGIDGTDEDKVKWWDNERSVFRGRVDSFIARMRLVQGDRRFTPWKGSVLDSVIGVFLTQNVSDHLSSSAFMSMAARFPLKLERNECTLSEEATNSPEVIVEEPEESATWIDKKSDPPICDGNSTIIHEIDCSEEKEVVNSKDIPADYSSEGSQKATDELGVNKASSPTTDTENSSQHSVISSQNSVNSSNFQTTSSRCYYLDNSTSFIGLLKMAETPFLHESSSNYHLQAESRSSDGSRKDDNSPVEQSNITTESTVHQFVKQKAWDVEFRRSLVGNRSSCYVLEGEKMVKTSPIWKSPIYPKETADIVESTTESDMKKNTYTKEVEQTSKHCHSSADVSEIANPNPTTPKSRPGKEKRNAFDWDSLRKDAEANVGKREKTANTMDTIDWEAVRLADVSVIADTIKARGMNNMLSQRIKELLDRLLRDHGSIDMEWLRDIPPDKAKEYLLSFRGLGLKSVECVRLLTLHHLAFPVDTNVGRIAVRLGWVPLQPLPESLQLHLLEMYPVLETIQKYLWPRLCKLDQKTLYELHYHMITFGKVFCTKRQPNCNACPLRGECRHFASAFASARLALPGREEKSIMAPDGGTSSHIPPQSNMNPLLLPAYWGDQYSGANSSIVEIPQTIQHLERKPFFDNCEPIVEVPASPEPEPEQDQPFCDIEDSFYEDPNEIPTIKLNMKEFTQTVESFMQANRELQEAGMSNALVALTADAASIPTPKLKNISRLRTEHQVYELPDTHPLLKVWDRREPDDPCSYLLAIWTPGETANSMEPPARKCGFEDPSILCNETCSYCSCQREANSQTVRGTLLIPCRTAMRGSFPLNGTYFQVNEVFADHDSSLKPIDVPRSWLWNLPRRTVYFGTSIPTIFRGLTTEDIQHCFWRGYVCVRGFEQRTRSPRPLMARLHFTASRGARGVRGKAYRDEV